jgi:peptide-methionine (S)-S-oxide reductase
VVNCVVGYSGGVSPDPTYDNMQDYTEALLVDFDPQMISYADILTAWRQLHTPYPNKRQYRSAIMYLSEEQRKIAESMFGNEKYVDIEPATKFYLAEEYHQNYLQKMKQMFR